jgi:hypothetical protein
MWTVVVHYYKYLSENGNIYNLLADEKETGNTSMAEEESIGTFIRFNAYHMHICSYLIWQIRFGKRLVWYEFYSPDKFLY